LTQEELSKDKEQSLLHQVHISQPACTAIKLALVNLLESWGIRPYAVTGHSSGEIAAAFAAGALTLDTYLKIASYRGIVTSMLKQNFPETKGTMLAIGTDRKDASSMMEELRDGQVVVAYVNSPSSITTSGDVSAIIELQKAAEKRKLFARRLNVDVA
jgi:acyl transferase domain-containing protein